MHEPAPHAPTENMPPQLPTAPTRADFRLRRLLSLTVLALALLPGTAAASSIAFIKDDNVWLTSPDGSRQRQVTTDGTDARGYYWPSQADDGTILAKLGDHFVRIRPARSSGRRSRRSAPTRSTAAT